MASQKYVVCKPSQERVSNEWFELCKQRKIPYVIVQTRTKYADVRFDYISLPIEWGDALRESTDQIADRANQIFKKYSVKLSKCWSPGLNIWFSDLPKEVAENAAEELFDLIAEYLPL